MKNNIQELNNYQLINYFEDAVRDDHYQPYDRKCNKSKFSYDELKCELERRLEEKNNTTIEEKEYHELD